ncbi:MAG TPA: aminoglycoside adenylyltransferase domain-containing protein [Bacillales bacterium]|nr:aminoglycoside adenylyltransferase domain-containing protein [Bacillales bacterium]
MTLQALKAPESVKQQLASFTDKLKALLGDRLIGVYLHGSLAMEDFNINSSDIDLLAVVHDGLSSDVKKLLIEKLMDDSGAPFPLEISFLTKEQLHPWRHPCPYELHFSEEWRERYSNGFIEPTTQTDEDLAGHFIVLRNRGMVLFGPPIEEVFPEVPSRDFLDSVLSDLDWSLDDNAIDKPGYAILNHCRTYAFLLEGLVISKGEGGEWMLEKVPDAMCSVVEQAIASYRFSDSVQISEQDTELFLKWIRTEIHRELENQGSDFDFNPRY